MTDECHSTGFLGKTGRGVHELKGVMGKVDIITGTLGKALGGASGGFTSGKKEIIEILRQRSRPYLFSNTLAPSITGASIAVFDLLSQTTELRDTLEANTQYFRAKITAAGFDIKPGTHPIVPIMLYERYLRHWFLLPCCCKRSGQNTGSNFCRTYHRSVRSGHRSLYGCG
jgi:glycine C-acetyltransferase